MPYEFDLVCIGSGPAGQRAAIQAAKFGKRVAVIERRRIVGGVCVDTGTIPSKTFREAVFVAARPFGPAWTDFSSGVGPRVTMEQLLGRIHAVMRREAEIIELQLRRNDVTLIRGHARFEDPHTLRVESELGQRLVTAAQVLIACGTRPAPPPSAATSGVVLTSDDSGLLKMLFHRETRKLLGVHAIGTGATELIHIGQAVMAFGGGLDYFVQTVFNYPTLAECYKVAGLDAANKLQT